ncbi:MAG TPA: hypothetical protein VII64_11525 [Thermodesulfobacteriota bacterium]
MRRIPFGPLYFCLLSVITVIYAWPLATELNSAFFGFPGDSLSGIWGLWWLDLSTSTGHPFQKVDYLAYPFGWDFSDAPLPYLFIAESYVFVKLFGDMVAFNLMKLASFPLLGLTAFYFLHYLTKDRLASALFGAAFAFSPYHTVHMMSHFANLYWLPLCLLFLLKSLREGGYHNAALFGLSWGLLAVDNAYFGFFTALLIPVFVLFHLDSIKGRGPLYWAGAGAIAAAVFFITVMPMAWPAIKASIAPSPGAIGVESRRLSDLFIFSAKPLDYLMPSVHNPFLGALVPDLGTGPLKGHRYTEHTLYLGYTVIALAAIALRRGLKAGGALRRDALLFVSTALFMMLISAPPFIPLGSFEIDTELRTVTAEHRILLPQYVLFKIFPLIRVYSRAGAVAMLAFIALAATGFTFFRAGRGKAFLIVALLLAVEFTELPGFRITRPAEPEVYRWLARQAGQFAIAEYPFGRADDPYTTYEYMFHQRTHGKRLVNTPASGSLPADFESKIREIDKAGAIEALSGAGVRYVVIHRDKYRAGNEYAALDWVTRPPEEKIFPPEWGPSPKVPGLRPVLTSGDDEIYELPGLD